jgi:hypothetical protein
VVPVVLVLVPAVLVPALPVVPEVAVVSGAASAVLASGLVPVSVSVSVLGQMLPVLVLVAILPAAVAPLPVARSA